MLLRKQTIKTKRLKFFKSLLIGGIIYFTPLLLWVAVFVPQSQKGTNPDSAVLQGSAKLLFIKLLRPLCEGYHTDFYLNTSHTLPANGVRNPDGWLRGRKEKPDKC